ncbi:hypothetical protein Tco_0215987 [Tanacetum coccineum]
MAWNLGPRLTSIESTQVALRSEILSFKQDTSEIKSMMTEIFRVFKEEKEPKKETTKEVPTRAVPISTIKPIIKPNPKVTLIESSSRPPLTDTILEILISQPTGPVIDITPPEPQVTQRERKGIATGDKKLLKKPMKLYHLTNDEIQEYLNKEEEIKKKVEQARLLAMTKSEIIKVVHEEAEKAKIDPKNILTAKALAPLAPEQASSQLSGRKRTRMELEPKICIPALECNMSLPEGVLSHPDIGRNTGMRRRMTNPNTRYKIEKTKMH